ncbi:phosphatidylserine decarboxylase [Halalkalibacter nanhaiisediminis]|uniref:Phosphatidylserine decarboxylase proenzyme n=1 Tax=Halalkalibacter nanhaiisediminis TaxID=688079 RepID=A0A562QI60_9BACI|nr:phosphatidylserine decarboxylase [Halalkalibacter nanhaiisediminis]TWI56353.1 phosphatidylserine decarboxylase [Halalkalibacter nanhaiisediminis]
MRTVFYRACIELTNHRFSSRLLKAFSRSKLSKRFVRSFSNTFGLNEKEMGRSIKEYEHLHDLFVRHLKPGSRPIDQSPNSIISPVDGVIAQAGKLESDTLFKVKGQTYSISEMLGSTEAAERYRNGVYIILYLSPSHYHRIHSPIDGEIERQWTLGSQSYPVNDWGLRFGKRPLSRNYRVVTELNVKGEHMVIVKVGAMNINTIELTHPFNTLKKGEEIGYFSFGSTVVLVAEDGLISIDTLVKSGEIKMGQKIGVCNE